MVTPPALFIMGNISPVILFLSTFFHILSCFSSFLFVISPYRPASRVEFSGRVVMVRLEGGFCGLVADDGRRVLKRSDHLYPYPEFEERPDDPVLCKDVKSLAFKYIDAEDNASESWNSESDEFGYATPQAVTVQLEIGDEKTSTIFETAVKLPIYREKAD